MIGMVLVASPKATTNKPVAAGSKVPAWPAFCALKHHFILLTTAAEEMPAGLSTNNQPCIDLPFFFRSLILNIAFDFVSIKQGSYGVHIIKSSIRKKF